MRYTYGVALYEEDGTWYACFPQFSGEITSGRTREEALREAEDLLTLLIAEAVEEWDEPPALSSPVECATLSLEIGETEIEKTHYMTQDDAAEDLDMSRSQISALIASGQLETKWFNGEQEVRIESVNAYYKALHEDGSSSEGAGASRLS